MRSQADRATRSLRFLTRWVQVVATLALAGALAACGGEESAPEVNPEWKTLSDRPCPEDSYLMYDDFGGPFMLTWCNGCHAVDIPAGERQNAPVGVDFDTLQDVRRQADRIWARAGDHNATMPPIGGPDADERTMLGEWLACGAPGDAP